MSPRLRLVIKTNFHRHRFINFQIHELKSDSDFESSNTDAKKNDESVMGAFGIVGKKTKQRYRMAEMEDGSSFQDWVLLSKHKAQIQTKQ